MINHSTAQAHYRTANLQFSSGKDHSLLHLVHYYGVTQILVFYTLIAVENSATGKETSSILVSGNKLRTNQHKIALTPYIKHLEYVLYAQYDSYSISHLLATMTTSNWIVMV